MTEFINNATCEYSKIMTIFDKKSKMLEDTKDEENEILFNSIKN